MSILATLPHAVPSLPIGLMPIAASPIAPIAPGGGEEPFGFCDVITELETPLQPAAPAIAGLPDTGKALPAPVPVVAEDKPAEIDVAAVMVGTQPPPVAAPAPAPAPTPVLPKPIVSSQPAPVIDEPVLTEAEQDIQIIPAAQVKSAPPPAVAAAPPLRPRWVLGSSSALTVARALPAPPKGERASLPEKVAEDGLSKPVDPLIVAPTTAEPTLSPPAFAPVSWVPPRDDKAKPDEDFGVAAPVVLFPTVSRPIAPLPVTDNGPIPADPVTPVPLQPVTSKPEPQLPTPGPIKAEPRLPTPIAARPIEAVPAQLPPELTRQIAQLLPPLTREPAEPAALTPQEPPVFPLGAPAPAPATMSAPQPIAASQPAPVDTGRSAWMDAMIERIADMPQADGRREAVIRLLPDRLGVVEVTVTERGDRLHVTMNAESAQARQMLSDAAPRLHDLAEARGLRFAQADVGGGQPHDRRPAGGEQQPQTPQRPRSAAIADAETPTADGDLIA